MLEPSPERLALALGKLFRNGDDADRFDGVERDFEPRLNVQIFRLRLLQQAGEHRVAHLLAVDLDHRWPS
jgi:hypothetical protein